MENTLENKAKFFAQYWGQRVINWKEKDNGLALLNCGYIHESGVWIELKPLSQITDEDAKWLCNHFGWNWHEDYPNDDGECSLDRLGVSDSAMTELMEYDCSHSGNKMIEMVDYLRSKGYALTYNGLSVEKQIEYGWIKLTD